MGADGSARAAGNAHRTHPGPRIRADAGITADAVPEFVAGAFASSNQAAKSA
ncbi:MAG: hypothetical protein V3U93_04705 [Alphaproteobacteria bacterium]